jgi:hypothetical protein
MREREGIEPRNERRIVGADLLSNREGHIQGAKGQGSREPTGVGDRGTSTGQGRELDCKDILITIGGIGWPEVGGNSIPRTLNR